MRATMTMHIDATPEQVFTFMMDSTATPEAMTMEVVHKTPDYVGTL